MKGDESAARLCFLAASRGVESCGLSAVNLRCPLEQRVRGIRACVGEAAITDFQSRVDLNKLQARLSVLIVNVHLRPNLP